MSLSRFSLFKQPSHQKFEYQPRYYDPVKEELQERVNAVKAQNKVEEGSEYRRIKLARQFQSIRSNSMLFSHKEKAKSRRRFIVILGVISYICYYILTRL